MYISRIRLKDIRCFSDININFDLTGGRLPWTFILGDNATGKTALLRSIAIGLCDEPSAAGLIKESEEGYIRRGKNKGFIEIEITPSTSSKQKYKIITTLQKVEIRGGGYEQVSKRRKIAPHVSWNEIFVCAYGAGRGTSGTGDVSGYSQINAVYSLFNYGEGLQNPELMLRRLGNPGKANEILEFLAKFMLGERRRGRKINLTDYGITFTGPWGGNMPLRDIADGFKSSFLWLSDFIGWAISDQPTSRLSELKGIVLVDELEQHLHPLWQEAIVGDLRAAFPHVQFITTTHSPIIVSSISQGSQEGATDQLIYLERDTKSGIVDEQRSVPQGGRRVDQILASKLFQYVTLAPTGWSETLMRATELLEKGSKRNNREEVEFRRLKAQIGETMFGESTTAIERELWSEMRQKMRERVEILERRLEARNDSD